jgi:uncharacterized metal-binding protein YceD (DUF177 family)
VVIAMELGDEFSRCIKIDTIGNGASTVTITADANERAALKARFDLLALESLSADISLHRTSGGIQANGTLHAILEQACIASGDPVPFTLEEPIDILFITEPQHDTGTDIEIELAAEDCDTMFYDGRVVDLGEATAQSLGLAIDPYPRGKGAEAKLRAAGVKKEEDITAASGPFAALSAIKDQLARK